MPLKEYRKKRRFSATSEPKGKVSRKKPRQLVFVIQKHQAKRLHWDLRLEDEGVLKSWAVTNEPSLDPKIRRLAVQVEDHPLEYGGFHGTIPKGEYGAGKVEIWDQGTYTSGHPLSAEIERGVIEVVLNGKKLRGRFVLVRFRIESNKAQWLFFKKKPKPTAIRIGRGLNKAA